MCGIVGQWTKYQKKSETEDVKRMSAMLGHRGPDDSGIWSDPHTGLALAHRRLSIIDLSEAGHQPMHSDCGQYVLIFNGEIYNHKDIRKELDSLGVVNKWKGHSDTETLLRALTYWGIEEGLQRLNGMFALAFFNRTTKTLYLARDRIGEKPLYFGNINNVFLFGSELKALKAHSMWHGNINRMALGLYLKHNYIPSPLSIYNNIQKLLPAHYISIRNYGDDISPPKCYWDLNQVVESGLKFSRHKINQKETINQLDDLLQHAVTSRMEADVSLGAFLSGGVDSTLVTAIMQRHSATPVRTFSIGFPSSLYNEAKHAKLVSKYLGTSHTELYVSPEDAMEIIPTLPKIWDEPFADSSQIPTFIVSRLARQHVTVSLSGDGGDELFYGYQRYFLSNNLNSLIKYIPRSFRNILAKTLESLPISKLNYFGRNLPYPLKRKMLGDRLNKLAGIITAKNAADLYALLTSYWKQPLDIIHGIHDLPTLYWQKRNLLNELSFNEYMMYLDQKSYLPDDILTKLDRASMAVGLEARVPLLDHRLVEFSWKIPISMKTNLNKGKWPLRQVLDRYIPEDLVNRPKMGFSLPIDKWLTGPLRDWAESLLNEKDLISYGFFNPSPIRKMWQEHLDGKRRWHYCLWNILMFQAWINQE